MTYLVSNLLSKGLKDHPLFMEKIWCQHGFFKGRDLRHHGMERTFNCSLGKKDKDEKVQNNRDHLIKVLSGHAHSNAIFLNQTHSDVVIDCDLYEDPKKIPRDGDAVVSGTKNLYLTVQSADCMPLLLFEPKAKLVAAIHAGWRGLQKGIIQNTLKLIEKKGGSLPHLLCAIGPCIWRENYVVDQRVFDLFEDDHDAFFKISEGQYLFDMQHVALKILKAFGVSHMDRSPVNTYADPLYFSYRRNQQQGLAHAGNQLSVIALTVRDNSRE